MKKTLTLLLALALVLSLAACGKKPAETKPAETKETKVPEATKEETKASAENSASADPAEYDQPEYWENISGFTRCPFYVKVGDVENTYYFRGGGSFIQWLNTELNTEGWYYYNDRIITRDGKYAVEPGFDDAFSSCCSYEMTPYSGPTLSGEEQKAVKKGVVYAVHSWTPLQFASWYGICLEGQEYPCEEKQFSLSGLRADYGDQEWINVYKTGRMTDEEEKLLLEGHVKMYAFPHADIGTYLGVITEKQAEKALTVTDYLLRPEAETTGDDDPIFTFYVPNLYDDKAFAGDVDLLFTYDNVIAYYVTVTAHEAGWKMP